MSRSPRVWAWIFTHAVLGQVMPPEQVVDGVMLKLVYGPEYVAF